MWRKACSKCGGDLFLEADRFGSYITCLQCGRDLRPDEEARFGLASRLDGQSAVQKEGRHHRTHVV